MDIEYVKQFLSDQYQLLNTSSDKVKYCVWYNIIVAKNEFNLQNYQNSLYLDVKGFISTYINSLSFLDYGYDELNNEKIKQVIAFLTPNEQLPIFNMLHLKYVSLGLETNWIDSDYKKIEILLAKKEKKIIKLILNYASLNIGTLLLVYLVYILLVFILIHPAPFQWMEIFAIELHDFSSNSHLNYIMNTLALITNSDNFGPKVTPLNIIGMISYIIGIIVFYVLISNFIIRKIADYMNIKG